VCGTSVKDLPDGSIKKRSQDTVRIGEPALQEDPPALMTVVEADDLVAAGA
jgi:hypothetical protein